MLGVAHTWLLCLEPRDTLLSALFDLLHSIFLIPRNYSIHNSSSISENGTYNIHMFDYHRESLIHDPIHGYIAFTAGRDLDSNEIAEQEIIDHPWLQRLRQIHQLQTAWWVFPSAEHMRFQHVLGAMHLASRAIDHLYPSLQDSCPDVPSRGYIESLMRIAALLHDVGHGPYGHFFDEHFLSRWQLTHEDISARIITTSLGDLIRGIRRNPSSELEPDEQLDPHQIAYLIKRPAALNPPSSTSHSMGDPEDPFEGPKNVPNWLAFLRSLFSGLYTVDNMDFVLRDAYMTGFNVRAFDLQRLLHYSFFTPHGLTLHQRGLPTLMNFIHVRAELFRNIYFHRTVRSLDISLNEIFGETMELLFPENPMDQLEQYRQLTEWSLLIDVQRWAQSATSRKKTLARKWARLLCGKSDWQMASEKTVLFRADQPERAHIFQDPDWVSELIKRQLPTTMKPPVFRIDVARHYQRPGITRTISDQNFLFDPFKDTVHALHEDDLFSQLPLSFSLCRIYVRDSGNNELLASALNKLLEPGGDSETNM